MPINHRIFLAQFEAIKKIADEGPCILIGRCADYALENYSTVLSVFIHADTTKRAKRISRMYDMTESKAREMILRTDKKRGSYYNYYTNKVVCRTELRRLSGQWKAWHRWMCRNDY